MTRTIAQAALAVAMTLPLLSSLSASAHAQRSASLLLVHGAIGTDLGTSLLPTLPVDLQIDGVCITKQPLQFGGVSGPLPLASGRHSVALSPADTTAPCTAAAVLSQTVTLNDGEQAALVVQESTGGSLTASLFDLKEQLAVPTGAARIAVYHTADAPSVDISLTDGTTHTVAKFHDLKPGAVDAAQVLPFTSYAVRVLPTGTTTVVAGPLSFSAANRALEMVFVVGSAADGTVTLIFKKINGIQ